MNSSSALLAPLPTALSQDERTRTILKQLQDLQRDISAYAERLGIDPATR
ncbi:hypothetical protein [Candidatus Cyanaurora vandensis]|nr:hypothetical protein [Candidatus Cyanaurora vandensis]